MRGPAGGVSRSGVGCFEAPPVREQNSAKLGKRRCGRYCKESHGSRLGVSKGVPHIVCFLPHHRDRTVPAVPSFAGQEPIIRDGRFSTVLSAAPAGFRIAGSQLLGN